MKSFQKTACSPKRSTEKGGIVILVCLMIMTLLSVTAFAVSKSAIRESAITGNVFQAARSESASNAGIDWFLAWVGEIVKPGGPTNTLSPQAQAVQRNIQDVCDNVQMAFSPSVWSAQIAVGNEMVLHVPNGSKPVQAFDLKLFFLGPVGSEYRDGTLSASGNKNQNRRAEQTYGWELVSNGQALVNYQANDYWRFQAARASKLDIRFN